MAGAERPYLVLFLAECLTCAAAGSRCAGCKPLGRPRLVPVTAPVVIDPGQRWQPKSCVPMAIAQFNRVRWQAYTATHRRKVPRRGKTRDGRGPITLIRKLRERHEMLTRGDGIEAVRFELIAAQVRDFEMLELAISRRGAVPV